jgi:hypothetical protein
MEKVRFEDDAVIFSGATVIDCQGARRDIPELKMDWDTITSIGFRKGKGRCIISVNDIEFEYKVADEDAEQFKEKNYVKLDAKFDEKFN